jgi:putative hydrolase of the HAD superfamily
MAIQVQASRTIKAILFDMNGTLRMREPHEPTQRAALERLQIMLGITEPSPTFWDELAGRYKAYGQWAQENLLQLSEEEIWTRWLLPGVSRQQIKPIAAELTLAWSERKGRVVPLPRAEETLVELKQRGYRLGVISNSMSSLDIPGSLEAFGWKKLFEVVILSSVVKCRKPAPGIFLQATSAMGVRPLYCAFVGNRVSKDVIGCKRAGFGLAIVIESPGNTRPNELDQTIQPDAIIHSLHELLGIFPPWMSPGTKEK